MQEKDYKWFLENYNNLYKEYGQKYLAIKNQNVIGVYSSYADAVNTTKKTEKLGTFIVQFCSGDETAYTNRIYSLNLVIS